MKANILVLGVGAAGVGEQIIKCLNLQNEIDTTIIGTDINENSFGRSLVDKFYKVPLASSLNYFEVQKEIICENNINFIFHGSDPDMMFLNQNRKYFLEENIGLSINSKEVINLCQNKFNTYEALKNENIFIQLKI